MTIPSPSSLHFRYGRDVVPESIYPSMDDFYRDLGESYRKVVRAFADAGCRYLQLDEVNLAYLCDPSLRAHITARGEDPAALPKIYAGMINAAIADIPADMTITMHLCRGNFRSSFAASGGYEPVAEVLFNAIKVHGYFMEYDSDRAGGFEPLRFVPKGKTVVLGLVTSKSGALESRDEIKRRIEQAAKFVPLDQLCLSPQCGFASTEEGNVLIRGRAMGEAAHDCRDRRGSVGKMTQRTKPPFRADHVGSLLRPAALKEARERRAKGEITADALKAVEDRAIEDIIKKQEAVGLQSISDGEFRRSWWHLDFLWGLDGVERHVMDTGIAFAAVTTRNEGVRVTGKIGFSGHPMLEHFKFLKAHTGRTPKMTIPAPSALYGRPVPTPIDKAHLSEPRYILRRSRPGLQKGGARVCRRRLPLPAARRSVHRHAVRSEILPADEGPRRRSGLSRRRLRRSHQRSDVGHSARHDGDDASVPRQLQIDLHGYRRLRRDAGGAVRPHQGARLFHGIRHRPRRRLRAAERLQKGRLAVLGLVTTKTGALESKDAIKRRIEEAAKFTDLDQLCLSPQCGFASTEEGNILAEDEQWAKLRMIVEVAEEVWG